MIKLNNNKQLHPIVITPGEPAGIGPDIVIMALQKKWPVELVICADHNLLLNRAKQIKLPLKLKPYPSVIKKINNQSTEKYILHIPLNNTVIPGQLDIRNSDYVINTLKRASNGCICKEFSALVTGPINKAIINQSGISFTGHTEFFEKISESKKTVMMLSNNLFRIALATTHIPISSVSQFINQASLFETLNILITGLQKYFNILHPKIYVCGLNPHAGDSGYIGKEEIEVIIPVLNKLRKKNNCKIIGPLSADTIFHKKHLNNSDVILTMYHDQGLPVLKYANFEQSVNITFGLPFIRTSVGHGTAIELAGSGHAKFDSMDKAISMSISMIYKFYEKEILQKPYN